MFHPLPGSALRGNVTRGDKDNAFRVLRYGWNAVLEPILALPPYLGAAAFGGDQ
jgi:hypothetical protein